MEEKQPEEEKKCPCHEYAACLSCGVVYLKDRVMDDRCDKCWHDLLDED